MPRKRIRIKQEWDRVMRSHGFSLSERVGAAKAAASMRTKKDGATLVALAHQVRLARKGMKP